jgi:ribosomal 50S subunit-associated protein YjgA (DUF615 family)
MSNNDLYKYYIDKQAENAKKNEDDRGRLARLIEIGKLMRKYDLNTIRTGEMEQLSLLLHGLKGDWSAIKASLQEKVKFV